MKKFEGEVCRRQREEGKLAVSDTPESRISSYLVTRDPSLKPTGEVTTTIVDKDGLRWTDVDCAVCFYVNDCGG